MIGTSMLWVGWFGFNGSALAADANAGMAMTVTHISAATASVWMLIEWVNMETNFSWYCNWLYCWSRYYYSCFGFVGPLGALLIGILAAVLCYYMVGFVKNIRKSMIL